MHICDPWPIPNLYTEEVEKLKKQPTNEHGEKSNYNGISSDKYFEPISLGLKSVFSTVVRTDKNLLISKWAKARIIQEAYRQELKNVLNGSNGSK